MPNPFFSFKQFTVYHHLCAMKVGIDGVLLGAWATTENAVHILDIGTGSGLIALMIAQRSNGRIDAIDIDKNAALQARENFEKSPWKDRLSAIQIPVQLFAENATCKYDLIVSNPPYFNNSLKAPEHGRNSARHTDTLSHEELIRNVLTLLSPKGKFCMILPVDEGLEAMEFAEMQGLHCNKEVWVHPKPNAPAKRLLMEFSFSSTAKITEKLTIETENRHQYSEEFSLMAKDYYLKL